MTGLLALLKLEEILKNDPNFSRKTAANFICRKERVTSVSQSERSAAMPEPSLPKVKG